MFTKFDGMNFSRHHKGLSNSSFSQISKTLSKKRVILESSGGVHNKGILTKMIF
jgi:hypothetical protein